MAFVLVKDGVVVDAAEAPFEVHPDFEWHQVPDGSGVCYGWKLVDGRFEAPLQEPPPDAAPVEAPRPVIGLLEAVTLFCLGELSKEELADAYRRHKGVG